MMNKSAASSYTSLHALLRLMSPHCENRNRDEIDAKTAQRPDGARERDTHFERVGETFGRFHVL